MRAFWAVLLLAVAIGVGYLALGNVWSSKRQQIAELTATESQQKNRMAVDSMLAAEAAAKDAAESRASDVGSPIPTTPAIPNAESAVAAKDNADTTGTQAADVLKAINTDLGTATPPPATDSTSQTVAATGSEQKPYEVEASRMERRDDGSTLVDGKFVIRGDGSRERPFETTWEHLLTAERTFDPKNKRKGIPQSLAMMDGKYVKIDGHVAFPLMVQNPKECLVMLNQWDGCCIGVPPTPYDAIEARLRQAVTGDARFATSGSIIGKLGIKPYVVGDWLVGLYMIEDGTLDTKAFGGYGGS